MGKHLNIAKLFYLNVEIKIKGLSKLIAILVITSIFSYLTINKSMTFTLINLLFGQKLFILVISIILFSVITLGRIKSVNLRKLFTSFLVISAIAGMAPLFTGFFTYGTSASSIPQNYYDVAEEHINNNYEDYTENSIEGLKSFLNQIPPFPSYEIDNFDCSESTARLEWLLEGAGFNASLAVEDKTPGHAWIVLYIDNNYIVLEPTKFTENAYKPPAIEAIGIKEYYSLISEENTLYTSNFSIYENIEDVKNKLPHISIGEWDWWTKEKYKNTF